MKITLDLPSVLTGGAVALVLGLVAGFTPQVTQVAPQRPATAVPLNGALRPAARDIVLLQGGAPPYVVPAGKILVITTFAYDAAISSASIWANGVPTTSGGYFGAGVTDRVEFAAGGAGGWPFGAGSAVEILNGDGTPAVDVFWATGYLEDA